MTETLLQTLQALYRENDEMLRHTYHRSLSFQDGLFDRWERAKRLGFGDNTSIYNSAQVFGEVSVGACSFIGAFTILDGGYAPVRIGAYVSIAAGVHVYSHDTVLWSLSGGEAPKRVGAVTIEDRCYVGSQSVIACGVHIASCSVVAANSFVNRNVPSRTIVGGSPAIPIGRVEGEGSNIRMVFD
ncbi:acyltransferase [Azospirillum argentinense]|uniref:Acyltransferase n=1 Tax=Azospirillum brasilense TaxID=192 RepID=A0A4D8Q9T0_AZOBR|nr:acyltransferase [Azospirillum argentinense]QCO07167.1 acyltransferase [Azospirillum argentinense]